MAEGEVFEVRLSRWMSLFFLSIGFLFLLAGMELAFGHWVLGADFGSEKPLLRWGFILFAIAIGLIITVNIGWYIIRPPLLMRISKEGVWFGTGFRYTPRLIPLRYLRSVHIGMGQSAVEVFGRRRHVKSGVVLEFEPSPDIPSGLATSAGISYAFNTLTLSKPYMNRPLRDTVDAVKRFIVAR